MHLRRSQGDSKSISNVNSLASTMPITNNTNLTTPSTNSNNTGRVSIYSMRERVIQNKMTQFMTKLAPDTETEVTSRLHPEVPAVRVDGHLTYCLYMTLQNLMHLNAIYVFLYHTVFWLGSTTYRSEVIEFSQALEKTSFEETQLVMMNDHQYSNIGTSINTQSINKHIYIALIGVTSFEIFNAFVWTVRKKLPYLIPRHPTLKSQLSLLLMILIVLSHLLLISGVIYHTIITNHLPYPLGFLIIIHLSIVILLDKPNLFRRSSSSQSDRQGSISNSTHRPSTSSSSTSSMANAGAARHSYRGGSASMQGGRKMNPIGPSVSSSTANTSGYAWSRWSSVAEEKIPLHECSTFYEQSRREADYLWPTILRRILLCFYRTLASVILYDLVPIHTRASTDRSIDRRSLAFLIATFGLGSFITHTAFLFPVKLQTTLHRIAIHLGQWRLQSQIRNDTIAVWAPECNSYTRGSVVKLAANSQQYFLAVQHLSNAAHPQSKCHAFLYRFFGDATYVLTSQFLLCIPLLILTVIWMIRGQFWHETIISSLMIFFNSYPIYKIVRDRVMIDFVEENESFQTSTTSKQKKST